jgi:hypothetical protein
VTITFCELQVRVSFIVTKHSKVDRGEWHALNGGRLYARWMIPEPHFYTSVHDRSYNLLRWESLFERGVYRRRSSQPFHGDLFEPSSSLVLDVGANIRYNTLLGTSLGHDVIDFEINPAICSAFASCCN